jgi:outer membrane receptor protein involved in Fe transport
LVLGVVLLPVLVHAGTTGKIAGTVVDPQQKPIVAATVAVAGTPFGAFTDSEGRFNILNVPPGIYVVRVSRIGFRPLEIQDAVVSADNTTHLDAQLQSTEMSTEKVVVTAERPPVDINLTSSIATIQEKEISLLPVQELQDIVNLQAGVVDGHFRGGRLGEVQYQVDGVSINNAFDNSAALSVDRSLLKEVQVISGTFDAEYGQAMSGVVNAVLKDGTSQFEGNLEIFGGGFFFPGNTTVRHESDGVQPGAIQNFTGTLSGPLPFPKTNFLVNLRRYNSEDYVQGTNSFVTTPYLWIDPNNSINQEWRPSSGNGKTSPLGYSHETSGALKVSNSSISNVKVSYQLLFNDNDGRRVNNAFRLDPDGLTHQQTLAVIHGLDWTHTLGKATYMDLSVRQNYRRYQDFAYEDVFDPRYDVGPPHSDPNDPTGTINWGVDLSRFEQKTNAFLFKGSLSSQMTPTQQAKAGIDLQLPAVSFGTPGFVTGTAPYSVTRHVDELPDYPGVQTYWPVIGAGYGQDEIEWKDLTLRAGLRLDYFDARSTLPSDLSNPANVISGAPLSTPVPTTVKIKLAPRLGVAYPITDRIGVHFAYGHFYQYPSISDMFTNADYSVLANLQAASPDYGRVMGNPDVEPGQTVQYEFGYKQALTQNFGYEVSVFYKDIRSLLGVEFIDTYNDATYARLTNVDFGNVTGVTFSLTHQQFGPASLALDYTWQLADGNSSDPRETATRAAAGEDPRPRVVPFNWDQRHTFNMTLSLSKTDVYSAAAILKVGSGQPYSPEIGVPGHGQGLEENSGRKPFGMLLDLRADRSFKVSRQQLSVYGRIYNVLDERFFNGPVYADTGDPFYTRYPARYPAQLIDPTRYYTPRRIELGFVLKAGG